MKHGQLTIFRHSLDPISSVSETEKAHAVRGLVRSSSFPRFMPHPEFSKSREFTMSNEEQESPRSLLALKQVREQINDDNKDNNNNDKNDKNDNNYNNDKENNKDDNTYTHSFVRSITLSARRDKSHAITSGRCKRKQNRSI